MRLRSLLKIAIRTGAGLCLASLVVLTGILLFLQTDAGHRRLASELSALLSSEPDAVVTVEGAEGFIPFRVDFRSMTVSDGKGPWLAARDVRIAWYPAALLFGRISIGSISASAVNFDRIPDDTGDGKSDPWSVASILSQFPAMTVDRFSVQEFAIGQAVTGRAAAFQVEGNLSARGRGHGIEASLDLKRKDAGPETRLSLSLASPVSPPSIKLLVEFHEESDGWLASALRFEEAGEMDFTLAGDGPPSAWEGSFRGSIRKFGTVQSSIAVRSTDDESKFSMGGSWEVSQSFPSADIVALMGDRNRFEFAANMRPSGPLKIEKAEFDGGGFQLGMTGSLDFTGREIGGRWSINLGNLGNLAAMKNRFEKPASGSLVMEGSLSGTIDKPVGTVSARLLKLQADRVSAEEITLDAKIVTTEPARSGSGKGFRLDGAGSAKGVLLHGEKPVSLESLGCSFDVEIPPGENISIKSLRVETGRYLVDVSGAFDPGLSGANLETALLVRDAKSAGEAAEEGAAKVAGFAVRLKGNLPAGSASGAVEGRLTHVEEISTRLPPLVGSQCTVSGAFDLSEKRRLTIPALQVESDHLHFTARADVDLSRETGKADWRLAVPKLDRIGPALGASMAGNLEAEGTIEGSFSAPRGNSTVRANGLEFHGREIGQIASTIVFRDILKEPQGTVGIDLRQGGQNLVASSGFSLKGGRLALSTITLKAPGANVSGNLTLDVGKSAVAGNLKGEFAELSALGRLVGEPLGGSASFDLRLDPGKSGQAVKLVLKGSGVSTRYGTVKTASISADLSNILDGPTGNAGVHVDGFERPGILLQTLDFKASGDRRGMGFEGSARGRSVKKFEIQTRGSATLSKDAAKIRLDAFKGNFGKYSFTLLKPAGFERTNEAFAVEDLAIGTGTGQLKVSGRSTLRNVSFKGEFEKIPLGLLPVFGGPALAGTASGRVAVEGSPSQPSGSCALRVEDMFYPDLSREEVRGAILSCEGKYDGNRLAIDFDLTRREEKPVTGRLGLPLAISFAPLSISVPPRGSLDGRIEARTNLSTLTALFPLEGHKIAGDLAGTVELGGTMAEPVLGGHATITNGFYENYTSGTVLKNARAEVAGKGNRIEIEEFKAADGDKGAISATGWVSAEAGNRFPLEIQASLSSTRLIRRGDSNAVAGGKLSLSGQLNNMTLAGNIEIESAEYDIQKRRPAPIASLKVIDVYGPGKAPPAQNATPDETGESGDGPPSPGLGLDLGIALPGKALLRGEGLNSEWKGNVRLRGPAAAPSVTGQLSVVRGDFQFLGQRFNLVHGVIQLDGATPPNPLLDVTAQVQAGDIKANVILSGIVSSPNIKLDSDPSLPPDEILSRILFKRSLNQINPGQAVKIASALSGLAGQGSAFDFLERTRGFLGLDQLDLRQPQTGQSSVAVGVGKYLTDQIYVDVQKDVGDGGAALSVQVEVTPSLTFESKVGTDADKGLEVDWKRDY